MKIRLRLEDHWSGTSPCPLPRITLRVRDAYGSFATLPFRIDTGADCSAIPLSLAQEERIPYQQTQASRAAGLVGTTRTYRDRFRVRIGSREHTWPCDFIEVPPRPPGQAPNPLLRAAILGRAGFLDDYSLSIDSGYLILTRLGPLRKRLRRGLHLWWRYSSLLHPPDRPL